jgi:transcriptional regulator with XRE-family HTH domain
MIHGVNMSALSVDEIGLRVSWWRRSHGMTQRELGEKLELTKSAICKLERGARLPSLRLFVKLCAVLRCSPGYLLGEPSGETPFGWGRP